jgi:lysylphosphatidylglycerol synthetase-like protein (DUF2156 family)
MHEVSRYLFLAGSLPFLFLGTAHAIATPLRPDAPRGLSPADHALIDSMSTATVRLTRRTTMWLAWIGFNFSHSLGAVLFGLVVVLVGRSDVSFRAEALCFGPLAMIVSGVYLVLAVKYWFRTPIVGCGLSFVLFLLSWALQLASG